MGLPARAIPVEPPSPRAARPGPPAPARPTLAPAVSSVSFRSLLAVGAQRTTGSGRLTTSVSLVVHGALIALLIVVPVLMDDFLPEPDRTVRAFFVSPAGLAPPPPPPPAGARAVTRAPAVPRPAEPARFVAPVEVPDEIAPEEGIDLGVEGGVPGGVEGGVAGGGVGGIGGGLPSEAPPPPARAIRVGGNIKAPRLVHQVPPEDPLPAQQGRVQGV